MYEELLRNAFAAFLAAQITFAAPAAPAVSPTQNTPKAQLTWVISERESMTSIAEKVYGDTDHWTVLWNDNPEIKNPGQIEAHQVLALRYFTPEKPEELNSELAARYKESQRTSIRFASNPSQPAPRSSNYDSVYQEAGLKYGVPWQILYGLHLTETGLRDGAILNRSGSGARGPMQFMPNTFRAYAVDGDGDGVPNIDNAVDAIHTAANFIARQGSVEHGLRRYMGNTTGTLAAAASRGYNP